MLLQLLLFTFLLILLSVLSQRISSVIYSLLLLLTRSERFSIWFLALLLLPGTVSHELSHFLIATLLKVPTGELSIFPTIEKKGQMKTGHLMIGESDPFRRTLIGIAPLIVGLTIIYLIGKYTIPVFPQLPMINYLLIIIVYLLFTVSSTMFSSPKDLESLKIAGPIVLLILLTLYTMGIRIVLAEELIGRINSIISDLNYYLIIASLTDFLVYFLFALFVTLLQKLRR